MTFQSIEKLHVLTVSIGSLELTKQQWGIAWWATRTGHIMKEGNISRQNYYVAMLA